MLHLGMITFHQKKRRILFLQRSILTNALLAFLVAESGNTSKLTWGPLNVTDEEFGGDCAVSDWIGGQLERKHEKPFFLACGIYRPHEPWFVPKKYFELFPIEEIQLPPGYEVNDLVDLPSEGKERAENRYFAHIREHDQWKLAIQGYLASIAFADAMVGRVLDALEKGPNRDNTIVVLWSDHGWHLGEKEHWQKFTPWRVCTRVPLTIRVPQGTPALPGGTKPGTVCKQPVNLLSLFPTLLDLAGLPKKDSNDGPSLLPLLRDSDAEWRYLADTHLNRPNNYSLSGGRWRYIHYSNGEEELYDVESDPFEWNNLAEAAEQKERIAEFRSRSPVSFADYVPAKKEVLPKLKWIPADGKDLPASRPAGKTFDVYFRNDSSQPVDIVRVDAKGNQHSYGTLERGWFKPYQSQADTLWLVTTKQGEPLGYFLAGDKIADATIPK